MSNVILLVYIAWLSIINCVNHWKILWHKKRSTFVCVNDAVDLPRHLPDVLVIHMHRGY